MSQWKDGPQRCQSVYRESTMHEKATVNNMCSRKAPESSTTLSYCSVHPRVGICLLNANIKHPKSCFGFSVRMCKVVGMNARQPEP